MFERTVRVKNMYDIKLSYVNKNDVQSNIQKYNRITPERKH